MKFNKYTVTLTITETHIFTDTFTHTHTQTHSLHLPPIDHTFISKARSAFLRKMSDDKGRNIVSADRVTDRLPMTDTVVV